MGAQVNVFSARGGVNLNSSSIPVRECRSTERCLWKITGTTRYTDVNDFLPLLVRLLGGRGYVWGYSSYDLLFFSYAAYLGICVTTLAGVFVELTERTGDVLRSGV